MYFNCVCLFLYVVKINRIIAYNLQILYFLKIFSYYGGLSDTILPLTGFNSTLLLQGLRERERSRDENAARLIRPR